MWGRWGEGTYPSVNISNFVKCTLSKMQANLCINADDTYGYFTING